MMKCATHGYGGAAAAFTVKTAGGTFHMCPGCAGSFVGALAATGIGGPVCVGPLVTDNPRQRCQCEHEDHFETKLDAPHAFQTDPAEPTRQGDEDVAHCADCGQAEDRPIHRVASQSQPAGETQAEDTVCPDGPACPHPSCRAERRKRGIPLPS